MKPLDPRMELSLLGERNANELFAERHGAELHAVPGVISVKARTVEEGAGGYSWKVNIVEVEVAPYADSAAIDAAVERYRYAGVDLRVMSRGWPIFHVNTRGERNELHMKKLDPRMALSAAA
jgi:hypothetical protein